MNMNMVKIGKLTLAAALGSLLLAGCASNDGATLERTYDPQQAGPDTHPQFNHDMIIGYPYQAGWTVRDIE